MDVFKTVPYFYWTHSDGKTPIARTMSLFQRLFAFFIASCLITAGGGGGNHAFEVLRTANQQYNGVDLLAINARLPADGLSNTSDWCRDYQNLCAEFGLRPTGCGEDDAVQGGSNSSPNKIRCVTEYNSDPYINNTLGCAPAHRVAAVANLAFSAGARRDRSFGFNKCDTSSCQRGIYESRWSLSTTTVAFGSDGSGDRIVYTVCAGSAGEFWALLTISSIHIM
ncbi:uncharacterized protein [Branchiostoma lanceolatum]|uniref:uncharacterized protein n=1 Tax=Branchiostoma lanceolatum TaxID=7740 RepID=UPI003455D7C4